MSFDELNKNDLGYNGLPSYMEGFEAGAQSRQSEIDELQKRVKELELINFDSELHFDAAKDHICELQNRIDEIVSHVEINFDQEREDDQHSYWSGYNQAMREMNNILKGE